MHPRREKASRRGWDLIPYPTPDRDSSGPGAPVQLAVARGKDVEDVLTPGSTPTQTTHDPIDFDTTSFRDRKGEKEYVDRFCKQRLPEECAMNLRDIGEQSPRILECYKTQGWTEMLSILGPVFVGLVQEFYSNHGERSDRYFVTWLRGHTI